MLISNNSTVWSLLCQGTKGALEGYGIFGMIGGADPKYCAIVMAVTSIANNLFMKMMVYVTEPKATSEKMYVIMTNKAIQYISQILVLRHYNIIEGRGTGLIFVACLIQTFIYFNIAQKLELFEESPQTQETMDYVAKQERLIGYYVYS